MKKRFFFMCCLIATVFWGVNAEAQMWTTASGLYRNARNGNYKAIQRAISSGYSIDTLDFGGNTALCLAIKNNDARAYSVLRRFGASMQQPCVRNLNASHYVRGYPGGYGYGAANSSFSWTPVYTATTVAVLGGAGVAAVLASSDSDSSKDKKHNGDGGGDYVPDVDIVTSLDPEYFETEEYFMGNFLDKINASVAYSRLYGLDADGNLATNVKKVKVGIMDSGVYKDNTDFANTNIKGFNSDYGPCLNGDRTNCWLYTDGTLHFTGDAVQPDYSMTQEEYNQWVAKYDPNYDWDKRKDNFMPDRGMTTTHMHGTHVAGLIAADKNDEGMHGVAFSNAELEVARWDLMSLPSSVISKLVDRGAQVINMSFGVSADDYPASALTDDFYRQNKAAFDLLIVSGFLKAADNNVVMVMSAGNDGLSQPGLYNGFAGLSSLEDELKDLFITVVATGHDGKIASYSNACGVAQNYCIAAPGGDQAEMLYSTGTYDVSTFGMIGTSMAAPVVTGSVALLMGAYPYLSPQQVVQLLFESADKSGEYANKSIYGNGMLDLAEATNPQGYLGTISGSSVDGGIMNISSSRIAVPSVFKESFVANMPEKMTVFDKYKRPFDIKFDSVVQTTHSGEKNFRNDLYNFSRHKDKKVVSSDGFSFGYAPSSYSNNDGGIGIADVSYKTDDEETSFFFAENSLYSLGTYNDKALFNPYLAMNDAYGASHKMYWDDDWSFKMGFMTGENGLYDGDSRYHDYNFDSRAYAFNAEVSYKMTPKINVTAMTGMLAEDDAMLGMNGKGALELGDSNTYYAGLMLEWQPFENWSFGGAYYHGWTDASKVFGSMISTSQLMSDSFALDGHYNINKTDVVGLQISSPLRIYNGHADFDIATGRDNYSDTVYRKKVRANLKPSSREYKFALYHNREITESVLFKSEVAVRLHPEHQRDAETDYRAMFGLSWAF